MADNIQLIDEETARGMASLESDPKLGVIVKSIAGIAKGMNILSDLVTKSKRKVDDEGEETETGRDRKSTKDYSGIDEDDDAEGDDEESEDGNIGKSFYTSDIAEEVGTLFDEAVNRVTKSTSRDIGKMLAHQREDILKAVDEKFGTLTKSVAELSGQYESLSKSLGVQAVSIQKSVASDERRPVLGYTVRDADDKIVKALDPVAVSRKLTKAVQAGEITTEQATDISERIQKSAAGRPGMPVLDEHIELLKRY